MADYICSACGYEGKAKGRKRGSAALEWALWLALLFPGPLYSIWRRVGVSKECPYCHKETIVKLNSGEGWAVKQQLEKDLGIVAAPIVRKHTSESFGRDKKQIGEVVKKKPVNPDQW